jgi:gamma-glutamylcyclotransferase
MDAHYDQVMAARSRAEGAAERTYFAYSTILDRAAFEEWRQQHGYNFFDLPAGQPAEALDVALEYDFPSRWWGGRVAGLVDRPGASVHGLLFRIPGKDWPIIQHKEGFVTQMCVERPVRFWSGGRDLEATAFTTAANRKSSDGPVSPRFVEALVRGAEAAGLPASWVASLRMTVTG